MVLIIDQFEETRRSPPSGWVFFFFSPFFFKHHAPRSIIPFALSPLDLSRDLQPFPSNYLSRSNSILSPFFSLDDSVANESYMLRPSQDYISFLGRKTGSRIASFPDRFQRQMADTRLVHRYGTYSGLLEMAYAAQTSGSREIYFRGDPRRFRRMFHTG